MPWSKQLFLSLDDLRLHRELLAGEPERLLRERLGHAGELEHHSARLDHTNPPFGRALARAHARLGRLLRDALVGEDVDPDLAAALDLARHGDTSRLDLAVGDPAGVERLEAVVAELDGVLAPRGAAAAAAVDLAKLRLLRHEHQDSAPSSPFLSFLSGAVGSAACASDAAASGASVTSGGVVASVWGSGTCRSSVGGVCVPPCGRERSRPPGRDDAGRE